MVGTALVPLNEIDTDGDLPLLPGQQRNRPPLPTLQSGFVAAVSLGNEPGPLIRSRLGGSPVWIVG